MPNRPHAAVQHGWREAKARPCRAFGARSERQLQRRIDRQQLRAERLLDALEERYPVLQGAIRDHFTLKRRPFIRFFACEEDLTHESPEKELPAAVQNGGEPLMVVGAMAGG